MNELSKARATLLEVGEESADQRIDNFLIRRLKGVPKSHVYRIVRSGEVRVNSGRVKQDYRVQLGDKIRVPPVRIAAPEVRPTSRPQARSLDLPVVFEDDALIVIDKPSGTAVHGGSGISFGVIESLRAERPKAKFLELAHRLDRDTSGLLIIGKKRSALVELHRMLRDGEIAKDYVAIVKGRWKGGARKVDVPLHKFVTAAGERRVSAREDGSRAVTLFKPLAVGASESQVEARLLTGRTHQIRVHAAHIGHPILGDDKYGDFDLNRDLSKKGVRRLFLHARKLSLQHPLTGAALEFQAPMPSDMQRFCSSHFNAQS
jgi:23S rRNA pseudouridine955/2504/2580 synthase